MGLGLRTTDGELKSENTKRLTDALLVDTFMAFVNNKMK